MRTIRPSRYPAAFRRSPLLAALAAAVTAPAAYAACTPSAVAPNLVFCVTNTATSGPGSLAQAFLDASNFATCAGTTPTIGFAIPGAGPFTIAPSGTLQLSCSNGSVQATLDGTSQTGSTPNTSSSGFNANIPVVVSGTTSGFLGISVQDFGYGASLLVKGMDIRNYTAYGGGTALQGEITLVGSRIVGNSYGISPDTGANIGGLPIAERNVFANSVRNISIVEVSSVQVWNNLIGTDDSGNAAAGGSGIGVYVNAGNGVSILNNVISGASGNGIELTSGAHNVTITGNKIGLGSSGAPVPNSGHGISSQFSNVVSITDNTIAFNGGDGFNMGSGVTHSVRRNSIHTNGGKAINLGNTPGQLPNDLDDPDGGANGLQNYPVISSILKDGTNTTVNWSLNSAQVYTYEIDFFSNPAASATPQATNYLDPAGLGFAQAGGTTSAGSTISGTTVIPGTHDFITATATNTSLGAETSELASMAFGVGGVLNPTSINFGNVVVNASSSPQNATITSIGANPYIINFLHGSNLCYGGPPAPPAICSTGGFICSTNCGIGTHYSSGQSCTITGTFAPTVLGAQSTTIYICDNAGGNPRTLTLTGNAIAPPPPSAAPSSHNFGNVEVGGSSAVQSFTLTNPSPASITLTALTVPLPFSIGANTCGGTLAANSSCTFDAKFSPTATGPANAAVTATASSGPVNIPVSGNGSPTPPPSITPPSIDFGSVQVGAQSSPGTFTLTSTGIQPVTLSSWLVPAPFALVSSTCGASLSNGQSCTANVRFVPSAVGPASGAISNNTSAGTVSAGLSGNGSAAAPVTIAPLSHEFGSVYVGSASAHQAFTLNNPALTPATFAGFTATPPFQLVSTTCTNPIPPQSSCTADAKFVPSAVGPASGSLVASVNGGNVSAALSGTGAPPPSLAITPASFDFGAVLLGTSSAPVPFQIKNPGSVLLMINAPSATGPFQVAGTDCTPTLTPNQSCTAHVRFTPTQANLAMGSLSVSSQFGPSSANLQGTGARQPAVQLATEPIEFGSLVVGGPVVQQTLRLTNSGNDILGINSIAVPRPFTLANACGVSLGAGDSCTFTVSFDPAQIGDFTQTLSVSTNAPNASSIGIRVHAQVQARPEPQVRVSPRTIGFGGRMGGTLSPSQRITLTNDGGVAANLSLSMTTPHFVILSTSCGPTLAPQRSCDADVAFQPQGFGPKQGQYVVTSNSPDSPVRVDLSGAGCRPVEVTQGRGTPPNNCAP